MVASWPVNIIVVHLRWFVVRLLFKVLINNTGKLLKAHF